jgi:hypothetical protein
MAIGPALDSYFCAHCWFGSAVGSTWIASLFRRNLDHPPTNANEGNDDGWNCDRWNTLMRSSDTIFVTARRKGFARQLLLCSLLGLLCVLLTRSVLADGGEVLCQRTSDSVVLTVFSAQTQVRTGTSDISLLVESAADSHPILDARVFVELESESGKTLHAEATRALARNKLLYCCLLDLPEAGHWTMKVLVKHGTERSVLIHHLQVAEAQPTILAYWKLLLFPPLLTFLFMANQFLSRSRA